MRITVFDFDDTIHATSYVIRNNWDEHNPLKLPELSASIVELLTVAKKLSDRVYIITNAEKGWIELSAQNHLPGCEEFFNQFHIITRDVDKCRELPFDMWKTHSFIKTLSPLFEDNEQHHLLAFGDLPYDRMAAMAIRDKFSNVLVKNIMMSTAPSLETLLHQHLFIRYWLEYMTTYESHLDIRITMTYNPIVQTMSEASTIQNPAVSNSGSTDTETCRECKRDGDDGGAVIKSDFSSISSSVSDMEDVFSFDT